MDLKLTEYRLHIKQEMIRHILYEDFAKGQNVPQVLSTHSLTDSQNGHKSTKPYRGMVDLTSPQPTVYTPSTCKPLSKEDDFRTSRTSRGM